jgi:hypothetical protein
MKPVTIDRALRDKQLLGAALGPAETWKTWLAILSAAFGLPLDDDELVEAAKIAGGRQPPAQRVRELWIIAGRRSGKSRIAAAVAVWIGCFERHRLAPGETGFVLILSASLAQAQLIHGYARAFIEASPILRDQLADYTADEIRLRNGIVIATHTNSFRSVRGRTLLACIFDEVAYWRDESSATPDLETYRAVKPALDASGGFLLGISSPYRKTGLLAQRHRDHFGKGSNVLVIQAATRDLNPTIAEATVMEAYAEDPASALSEWGGEFRSDLSALFGDEVIDRAVDHARPLEVPPRSGVVYKAFVDASAGRHDAFGICIGHVEKGEDDDKRFVADVVRGRFPPFDPNEVAREYAELAKAYRVNELRGDRFAGEWVRQAFLRAGVDYENSDLSKSELALEALSTFNRGRVSLPNDEKLIRELRLLERQTHRSGKDSVDHPKGGSDDRANCVFGAMWACGVAGSKSRGEVRLGVVNPYSGEVTWVDNRGRPSALKAGPHQTAKASPFWKKWNPARNCFE